MALKKLVDYGLKFKELKVACIALNKAKITGVDTIVTKVGTKGEVMLTFFLDAIDQVPDDCMSDIPEKVVKYHKAVPQEVYDDDEEGLQSDDTRVHSTPQTTKKEEPEVTSECADFKTGWDEKADDCAECANDYTEEHDACKAACTVKPEVKEEVKAETKEETKEETKAEEKAETKAEEKAETKAEVKKDSKDKEAKEEKPATKKTPAPKNKGKRTRYGHMPGSMAATIDDMVWKGSSLDDIVKDIVSKYERTEKAATAKVTSHIKHLTSNKGIAISDTDGVFKAADEFAKGFNADNTMAAIK